MLDDRPAGGIQSPVAMEDSASRTAPRGRCSERPRMKTRWMLIVLLTALVTLQGCGAGHRRWGKGTYIPAAVCAVVGGFAGAAIESQGFSNESIRSGQSCGTLNGSTACKHDTPDYAA